MFHLLKIVVINFLVLFLGLLLIELIFGKWLWKSNYSNLLIPKQQTNLINSFPYVNDTLGIYSRDENGFRANNYNLRQINILVLGGSTTEEREVDDKKIWTKIFEQNLKGKFKVLNAGIGGQTSHGHKSMFEMWFSKFPELQPKYILVYLGINDALYLLESLDNQNLLENGRVLNATNRDQMLHTNKINSFIQYVKNNSALHSFYLVIKGNIISRKYKMSYNSKPKKFNAYQPLKPTNLDELDNIKLNNFKDYYFNNLKQINTYSKKYNAELILITQIVSKDHWIRKILKNVNYMTISFCKQNKLRCIDLDEDPKIFDLEIFYDGIHTNPNGSKLIGEMIAKQFNSILLNY